MLHFGRSIIGSGSKAYMFVYMEKDIKDCV